MFSSLFSALWTVPPLAPLIPSFCAKWRWVINLTSRPFERLGKNLRYQLSRRLGGPQSWLNILENRFSCPCWELCMWLWNLFCESFRCILIAFLPRYFVMISVRINSRVLLSGKNCLHYQKEPHFKAVCIGNLKFLQEIHFSGQHFTNSFSTSICCCIFWHLIKLI